MALASNPRPSLDWFRNAKYGLFIHWGIYSVLERGEQVLYREHLPPSEYRKLAERFRPHRFDPDDWAATARRAHMGYALLTTKHHDGFCMWDSETTDFTAAKTGLKRDYVAAYVKAFRRAGLKVGLYFSTADWSQPAYFEGPRRDPAAFRRFINYTHEQVRELCTNYGKIDVFWFDGVWPYTAREWRARELVAMIRRLQGESGHRRQPGIIVNDRIGLAGDIATPEQTIPEQQFKPRRTWESCMTSTDKWWGYHKGARWKSDLQAIRELCQVVEVGGNLVYNVGPRPDGSLPPQFKALMRRVGDWLDRNGAAIFGTTETICDTTTFGLMTCGARTVYLHVLHWAGGSCRLSGESPIVETARHPSASLNAPIPGKPPTGGEVHLAGLKNRVRGVRLLATDRKLRFRQEGPHLYISGLPARAPDARNTVIAVDVVGKPASHPWSRERIWTGSDEKSQARSQRVAARLGSWSRT